MALVDYDSDSESDSGSRDKAEDARAELQQTKHLSIGLTLPAPKLNGNAHVNTDIGERGLHTLPPPKFKSQEPKSNTSSSPSKAADSLLSARKSRILGGGAKTRYFDGEIRPSGSPSPASLASPETSSPLTTSEERSAQSADKVVPASVAARKAKYGGSVAPKSKLNIEQQIALYRTARDQDNQTNSNSKSHIPSLFTLSVPPDNNADGQLLTVAEEAETDPDHERIDTTVLPLTTGAPDEASKKADDLVNLSNLLPRKRRSGDKLVNVVDFVVDDYYKQNEQLLASGELEVQKRPVKAVASGRHQLSSLIRTARDNQEGLEEQFSQNKRVKREANAKYGF